MRVCKNMVPYLNTLLPFYTRADYSTGTTSGSPRGGALFRDAANTTKTFLGTATKLFRLNADKTITDVTKSGATYSASRWSFVQYGDWVIAADYEYNTQVLKGFTATNYVDLGGSPPKSKYLLLFNGMLFHLFTNDGNARPKNVTWSDIEAVETYGSGAGDTQTLADADGAIVGGVVAAGKMLIFHENSITVGYYSGYPSIMSFTSNAVHNIAPIESSMISIGDTSLFWAKSNIFSYDGVNLTALGTGVWDAILEDLDLNYAYKIQAIHDPHTNLVWWAYPSAKATSGTCDKILIYSPTTGRFSIIEQVTEGLFFLDRSSIDLESLATMFPDIDGIQVSFDSTYWLASAIVPATMNSTSNKVCLFVGSPLDGYVETGEVYNGRDVLKILNVVPQIESPQGTVSAAISSRMLLSSATTSDSYRNMNQWGKVSVRKTGRYVTTKFKIVGGHQGFHGFELDVVPVGKK